MTILVIVLAVLLVVLFVVHVARRNSHPYTPGDLDRKRKQSLTGSRAILLGKVSEQLAPLWPAFAEKYPNLRYIHFLGEPIDFVVFDGLEAGEVSRIVFVEVKTGKSQLNPHQRLVRDAVEAKRVEWDVVRLDQAPSELTE